MKEYEVQFTKEALKDLKKLSPFHQKKAKQLILNQIIPSPYSGKKLVGDLEGFYSIRLSFQDRIVYSIDPKNSIIMIHRSRTHYGD